LKAQCDLYVDKLNAQPLETNQLIDFSKKSDVYLKEGNYTESTIELFARTFEVFLQTKSQESNRSCPIIHPHYDSDFYPQSKIKETTNNLWNNMWHEFKTIIDKVNPDISQPKLPDKFCVMRNIEDFRNDIMKNKGTGLKIV
jgi:hypothetical protein